MTKTEQIISMFKDDVGWKVGIRNGLTILQILDKLGIKPQFRPELWEEKNKICSLLTLITKDLQKEKVPFFGLPFSKRQTRIYFIVGTKEEAQRCINFLDNRSSKAMKKYRRYLQEVRGCVRKNISNPKCTKKAKKEWQAIIDKTYESMGT